MTLKLTEESHLRQIPSATRISILSCIIAPRSQSIGCAHSGLSDMPGSSLLFASSMPVLNPVQRAKGQKETEVEKVDTDIKSSPRSCREWVGHQNEDLL